MAQIYCLTAVFRFMFKLAQIVVTMQHGDSGALSGIIGKYGKQFLVSIHRCPRNGKTSKNVSPIPACNLFEDNDS